ncbi:pyrroline-5-carboxylate reductase [Sphingomonas oligophenolica]|uniref:Pyrroline-5-carboxylate reductase n=1 Tax=Sphingomonas oligophenolica TaxID=301154 RepID=A0A502CI60_9SPHN|nr:pyrroline-5-carboxylate reductase [Sphingomonas oligophenolica]TPG12284.1 pyrroline-5-carboxylate reductase [Sphingomonas oligophenolica]
MTARPVGAGPLWLIGCGHMGGAMLRRWIAAGMAPSRVTVITRGPATVPAGVRHLTALPLDAEPETIVLAMKPQQLGDVAPTLQGIQPALLVSILAGVDSATLAQRIAAGAVVRAMPNLPVAIGQGVTALFSESHDAAVRATVEALAAPLGHHEWIADESLFDAVTALAGSGPGFVFRFIDALARAGEALGIPADQAARFALATVSGSAAMAVEADVDPATLADRVASKGGSTREGLDVLDADGALVTLLTRTLDAARRRNTEMAAAARE